MAFPGYLYYYSFKARVFNDNSGIIFFISPYFSIKKYAVGTH